MSPTQTHAAWMHYSLMDSSMAGACKWQERQHRSSVRTHTDLAQHFAPHFHVDEANRVTFIVQMKFVSYCSALCPMPLTIMDAQHTKQRRLNDYFSRFGCCSLSVFEWLNKSGGDLNEPSGVSFRSGWR